MFRPDGAENSELFHVLDCSKMELLIPIKQTKSQLNN